MRRKSPRAQWRDRAAGPAIERRGNCRANRIRRAPDGIGVEMRVTLRGRRLRVAQKLADDQQTEPGARADAGEGMAEIVNAKAGKRGSLDHRRPGLLEIGSRRVRIGAGMTNSPFA